MTNEYINPNWQDETWRGKSQIPDGWIAAQTQGRDLLYTSIPVKKMIRDWIWRNGHAEPVFGYCIPDTPEYVYRDKCIADYYTRLKD